jgi:hypothetical protein
VSEKVRRHGVEGSFPGENGLSGSAVARCLYLAGKEYPSGPNGVSKPAALETVICEL